MKQLGAILITIAALLGVSWAATETFGDRELFTSPPDAVSEGFVREVVMERYDQAKSYTLEPEALSESEWRRMHETIEGRVGDPSRFEAETVSRDADRAEATVTLESEKGPFTIVLALRWEKGAWKVLSVPSVPSVVKNRTTENTESTETPR